MASQVGLLFLRVVLLSRTHSFREDFATVIFTWTVITIQMGGASRGTKRYACSTAYIFNTEVIIARYDKATIYAFSLTLTAI